MACGTCEHEKNHKYVAARDFRVYGVGLCHLNGEAVVEQCQIHEEVAVVHTHHDERKQRKHQVERIVNAQLQAIRHDFHHIDGHEHKREHAHKRKPNENGWDLLLGEHLKRLSVGRQQGCGGVDKPQAYNYPKWGDKPEQGCQHTSEIDGAHL